MDGMALIGNNIPSLGNQELLVRLIFGIGMAFAESFGSQKGMLSTAWKGLS